MFNGDSHTFAHEQLPLRSLKLVQSQLLVQVLVGEVIPSLSRYLELRTQPLAHPIASVAVDVPVGLAHRPEAEVVGPAAKFAVDPSSWPKADSRKACIFEAICIVGSAKFGADWTGKELQALDWPVQPQQAHDHSRSLAPLSPTLLA